MTRRSRPLDMPGMSRGNLLDGLRPLPEKPEEPTYPSFQSSSFDDRLFMRSELNDGRSSSTSTPPPTGRFSNEFFTDTSSMATDENTVTGRSSTYSWGNDDEFDRKASAEVQFMFAKIDSCLFENGKYTQEILDECADWVKSFPFLRVLGKQLVASEESGTEMILRQDGERSLSSSLNGTILEDVEDDGSSEHISLAVVGQKMKPTTLFSTNSSISSKDDISHLREEVFASDGEIEEFIAYDKNSTDYRAREKRKSPGTLRKKYGAVPPAPVTPDAFVHETSINECFDQIWVEVIHILKRVLKLYITVRAKKELDQQRALLYTNMDGLLDGIIEFPQSRDDFSRVSRLPSQLRLKGNSSLSGLKELMTIRSVSLQRRASSVITDMTRISTVDDPLPKETNSRPVSSSVVASSRQFLKPSSFRTAEQQFYDRMPSAKVPKRTSRLQPIQTPKTPSYENDRIGEVRGTVGEVRGTRLQTAGRSSPIGVVNMNQQLWGARNGMLPPIERVDTADTTLSYKDKISHSPKRNGRSSSALSNDTKTVVVRDRLKTYPNLTDSRPSTSQSYRDLIPGRSIMSQQGKLKDPLNSSLPRPIFQQTINEKSNLYPFSAGLKSYGEDSQDFDDLVLWGHGPPRISSQPRSKGKSFGSNMR